MKITNEQEYNDSFDQAMRGLTSFEDSYKQLLDVVVRSNYYTALSYPGGHDEADLYRGKLKALAQSLPAAIADLDRVVDFALANNTTHYRH